MFTNLRQGGQIFILHKSATPYIEIGTVETISNMPLIGYYPNMPAYPIDITVRIGEKVVPYQKLPANAEAVDVTEQSTNEVVTIACTKDALNTEVTTMRQKSIDIVNSVEYHKQRIEVCDMLLRQINPEQAEKAQQAQEITTLKEQVAEMQRMLAEQIKMNKEMLAHAKSETSSSKSRKEKSNEYGND